MRFRVVIITAALVLGWRLAPTPGVRGAAAGEDAVDPATREMAALLRERAAAVNPEALSLIVNDKRAELLNGLLARPIGALRCDELQSAEPSWLSSPSCSFSSARH